jgi:hypothetical protein
MWHMCTPFCYTGAMRTHRCSCCNKVKSRNQFAMQKWNSPYTGRIAWHPTRCLECHRERSRRIAQELRRDALAALGNKCARCGITDVRVLQIDHPRGGGHKEFRKIGSHGVYRSAIKNPKKYQALCANCNIVKACEKAEMIGRPIGKHTGYVGHDL